MASVYRREIRGTLGSTWYIRYRNGAGAWVRQATNCVTKAEAQRFADDLERKAERERLCLEQRPTELTFNELADTWLEKYARPRLRSALDMERRLAKHLRPNLGKLLLREVTPLRLEEVFNAKLRGKGCKKLSPQSVVHLRNVVRKMFNDARRWRLWTGENPATMVDPPRVVRKPPMFASVEDVRLLLATAKGDFRNLAAIAIYSGLREGEIVELRRESLDFKQGLIMVERTVGSDTTKGKKFRAVPIASELRPFLDDQLTRVEGGYLFAQLRQTKGMSMVILRMLRATQVEAGLIQHWEHICRRKRCRHRFLAKDGESKRCPMPDCGMKLWARPIPKRLTFHALRHTYVSHLLMKGANPVAVQRMAGHASLEVTLGTYGHLVPEFMKAEAERLTFGITPPTPVAAPPAEAPTPQVSPMPPAKGDLLTVREVAERLRLSTASVYSLCEEGKLKCYRLPTGMLRISLSDLRALLGEPKP